VDRVVKRAAVKSARKAGRPVRARLPLAELRRRAAAIRLVVTDVDGVLTDAGVYYSARGEELKRFSLRDGMGVERLRSAGIETAFMTGETSECVSRRAEKLRIADVFLGVKDKAAHLDVVLQRTGRAAPEIAFIGDDVNDLALLERVGERGLTGAPADATTAVASRVHHRTTANGGHGAFRDFAEWILGLRSPRTL
jgi:3-deoxy-D-manno-octulosonate 8-phosphate phosphatase (KDO 8-P phosphatase)